MEFNINLFQPKVPKPNVQMYGEMEVNGRLEIFKVRHRDIAYLREYLIPIIKAKHLRYAMVINNVTKEIFEATWDGEKILWTKIQI